MNLGKSFIIFLLFFNVLNILDFCFTFWGINTFGFRYEQNNIIINMVLNYGWIVTFFVKVFGGFVVSFILWLCFNMLNEQQIIFMKIYNIFVIIIAFIYLFIVTQHLTVYVFG